MGLILEGEVANRTAQRQIWQVRNEAYGVGDDSLVKKAEEFAAEYDKSLDRLHGIKRELKSLDSSRTSYNDLLEMVDKTIVGIKGITDAKGIVEETAGFVDEAKR